MLKSPLPLVLSLFGLLTIYARAELSAEHQEAISELLEAHYTAVPYERKYWYDVIQDYRGQNKLKEDEVTEYVKVWAKQNWQRIFHESINKLDSTPLESTSDPDVATGKKLPTEFASAVFMPYIVFEFTQASKGYPYSHEMDRLSSSMFLARMADDIDKLPATLKPYGDTLPPTKRDLDIANVTIMMIFFMEQQYGYFTGTTVDAWEPLIDSKNPLYRFLALWSVGRSVPKDLQQYSVGMGRSYEIFYLSRRPKYELYQRFFDDECIDIKIWLYRFLGGCHFPESLDYLKAEKKRWEAITDEEDTSLEIRVPKAYYSSFASTGADPFAPAEPAPPPEKMIKVFSARELALEAINESIKGIEEENATMPEKYRKMIEVYEQTGQVIEVDQ